MRVIRDRSFAIVAFHALNMDAYQIVLALVPRRDLTPDGGEVYCALRADLTWTALDRCRGRWWPRVRFRSDAPIISRLIAERAGQLA